MEGQSKILSYLSLSNFISKVSRLNLLQVLKASIFALSVLILIIPAFRSCFAVGENTEFSHILLYSFNIKFIVFLFWQLCSHVSLCPVSFEKPYTNGHVDERAEL